MDPVKIDHKNCLNHHTLIDNCKKKKNWKREAQKKSLNQSPENNLFSHFFCWLNLISYIKSIKEISENFIVFFFVIDF